MWPTILIKRAFLLVNRTINIAKDVQVRQVRFIMLKFSGGIKMGGRVRLYEITGTQTVEIIWDQVVLNWDDINDNWDNRG